MANVIFKFGTREQYDKIQPKDANTLYWLIDEQAVYKGDQLFGVGRAATQELAGLLSAEDKAALDKLIPGGVMPEYTIEKDADDGDSYTAVYHLKKTVGEHSEYVGEPINIPKDLVIKSGTVEKVTEDDKPYAGAKVGDLYIDLVLNDAESSHIYIPANEFVDEYAAGVGIEIVDRKISVKLDSENANGLSASENGLALALATKDKAGAQSANDKKFLDAIPVLYDEVHYEFFSLLKGTRVSQHDKEYRVMFPADTEWPDQAHTGEDDNYDAKNYYFAFRAYAPNDSVVAFKEDTAEIIADPTLYTFNDQFAGIDEYGRKYSVVWLPAAKKTEDGSWTYHGAKSTADYFVGWYYTVEWYDKDNNIVSSDTIRINLSNEECHNSLRPFLGKDNTPVLVWQEM